MRRRIRAGRAVLLAAAVGSVLVAGREALAGITPNSTSRVTIMHDPDISRTNDLISTTLSITAPRLEDIYPTNAYLLDNAYPRPQPATGASISNSEAAASLGQATTSTTAGFQLAPGTGVTQTDPNHLFPGASMLRIDTDLLWNVTSGGFGPNATGFASFTTGGVVGAGGSAELHLQLNFEDTSTPVANVLRSQWKVDRVYGPGPMTESFTTAELLRLAGNSVGTLPVNTQFRIWGFIEMRVSNDGAPSDFHPVLNVGATPQTGRFKAGVSGNWSTLANWESVPGGQDGFLAIANGTDQRALFSDPAVANRTVTLDVPVTLGTLDFTGNGSYTFGGTVTNSFRFLTTHGNAVLSVRGNSLHNAINAPVALQVPLEAMISQSNDMAINGIISGGGGITKSGAGRLVLSGANTFTGVTTVKEGTLELTSNNAIGTGNVTVSGAGVPSGGTLAGNSTITGIVTIQQGGHLAPGSNGIGIISPSRLTLQSGATLDIEGSNVGFDRIVVGTSGGFSLAGPTTVNLVDRGGALASDYVIIDYSGLPLSSISNLSLPSPVLGKYTAALVNDVGNTNVVLRLQTPQWGFDGDGSWGIAGNWLPVAVPTLVANFLNNTTSPVNVTLDGNRSVLNVNFDNLNGYTIARGSSGTLTVGDVDHGGNVTTTTGPHTISAPLTLGGNTTFTTNSPLTISGTLTIPAGTAAVKDGTSQLTISGAQSYGIGASMTVRRGRLNLNSNAGANLVLTLTGSADGTATVVSFGANQDLEELVVDATQPGLQSLDLNSPTTLGGFRQVRIFSDNLDAARESLQNAIDYANRPGAPAPQDGIFDSHLHTGSAIGLKKNDNQLLLRPTKIGDVNLDGSVTIADFIDLASHFNSFGAALWEEGDVNYDRNVTIADFISLASNFNTSYSGESWGISDGEAQLLADFAAEHGAAVPEPGIGLLMISGAALLPRRKKRGLV